MELKRCLILDVRTSSLEVDLRVPGNRDEFPLSQAKWSLPSSWLSDPSQWPADILTKATDDSNAEKKVQRELFALGVEANDDFDTVLEKFGLRKAMRICAWISRFSHNSRHPSQKIIGPLTTEEIQLQDMSWIKRAQSQGAMTVFFARDRD